MFSQSREQRLQTELLRIEERKKKELAREADIEVELKKIREKKNSIFGPDAADVGASHPSLHMERHPFGPQLSQEPRFSDMSGPAPSGIPSAQSVAPPQRPVAEPLCLQPNNQAVFEPRYQQIATAATHPLP